MPRLPLIVLVAATPLFLHTPAFAQRSLHWDAISVTARLDATGRLHVDEQHTMVFTGDWNGGERRFNMRPHQGLAVVGLFRDVNGSWQPLREDPSVDDVDEYAWVDDSTLRWRSREVDDAPFAQTTLRYLIRYELTNILLKDEETYVLDHDFLFPDRDEVVRDFTLRLSLDEGWQPREPVQGLYTASNVRPGDGFVVTLPLAFDGTGEPAALDTKRSVDVRMAVSLLLVLALTTLLWVMGREWTRGRFTALEEAVDENWLREHVFQHPAEIVGAAWDETVGSPEVVALIARMTKEGTLTSDVTKGGVLSLRLNVARETLHGHERIIVDRLFFNNRVTTNTQLVKQHYRKQGFNPSLEITPELQAAVAAAIPEGRRPRPLRFATRILLPAGVVLLAIDWFNGYLDGWFFGLTIGACIFTILAIWAGWAFRTRVHWTSRQALMCLLPAVLPVLVAVWLLWEYFGLLYVTSTPYGVWGVTLLALAVLSGGANAIVSRQYPAGIAYRKRLGAARAFFAAQLRHERPALRDEWSPWLLALGLDDQMSDWSVRHAPAETGRHTPVATGATFSAGSGGAAATSTWTGFGGGRSGGAGGGTTWAAAASGMAAGVSPPSSSGSSGGGSSGSSSSSGGSSGGGGGGGW